MDPLRREASPLLRYRSGDLARVWTSPCACGRGGVRVRIEGRLDDMLRVQAVNVHPGAIGAVLGRFAGLGRYAVVADGDPIVPPLRVFVETANAVEGVTRRCARSSARASRYRRWRRGAAGGRAEDARRVPHGARRGAGAHMSVTVTELGAARVVQWDRQANRNAWTRDTIEAIADGIEAAGADEEVRCVVARGAGEHFSAGDDLFAAIEATPESWAATVRAFQRVTRATLAAPIPVLAAIDGVCIGGALEFAASCDLRLATDRARFGTPEVGIGLTYTNAGSHFLPSTMGETAARELLLTGALRDVAWAQRHRFVNEVVPAAAFEERIAAWAAGFDDVSRAAVARTKAMLNDRFGDLLDAAMEREERACIELFDGPDAPAALAGVRAAAAVGRFGPRDACGAARRLNSITEGG